MGEISATIFCIEIFDTEKPYNFGKEIIPKNTVVKKICYGKEWFFRELEELSEAFKDYDCKITKSNSETLYRGNISNVKGGLICE